MKDKKIKDDANIIKNKKFYLFDKDYDNIKRWNSYFVQIKSVIELKPQTVLEIGKGRGVVANYLKSHKINVKTLDINKKLKPDFLGNVRKIPIKDNSFDVVLCSQVLEHLPFSDFEKSLREIHRVTKRYCVLSLPYHTLHFGLTFKFSGMRFRNILFRLPILKNKRTKYHYWEMGKIGYGIRKIRRIIRKSGFKIMKEEGVPFNEYHHFFILSK
jgi:ubiquinone/menaquinone biosynthesis C-methylase UbiE